MMGSSLIMLISSIGASFAPNISVFSFLRFITAASVSGLFQTGYILGTNFSNSSSNNLLLIFLKVLFYILLKINAYFIKQFDIFLLSSIIIIKLCCNKYERTSIFLLVISKFLQYANSSFCIIDRVVHCLDMRNTFYKKDFNKRCR